MTSQVLRSLENKGYIERLQRTGNEKSKFPRLTKNGESLLKKALPLVETVDLQFFNRLGHDLEKGVEILQRLV